MHPGEHKRFCLYAFVSYSFMFSFTSHPYYITTRQPYFLFSLNDTGSTSHWFIPISFFRLAVTMHKSQRNTGSVWIWLFECVVVMTQGDERRQLLWGQGSFFSFFYVVLKLQRVKPCLWHNRLLYFIHSGTNAVFYKPVDGQLEVRSGYLYKSPPANHLRKEVTEKHLGQNTLVVLMCAHVNITFFIICLQRSWKKRFFVLFKVNDNLHLLKYFKSEQEKDRPIGGIDLARYSM